MNIIALSQLNKKKVHLKNDLKHDSTFGVRVWQNE